MTDLSTITEEQVVISEDKKIATKYKVVSQVIDIDSLRKELVVWQEMKEPEDKELIDMGKMNHPYYLDRGRIIEEIKAKLEGVE